MNELAAARAFTLEVAERLFLAADVLANLALREEHRKGPSMSERTDADKLAERLLEEPYADPDDDLRVLSRQLLRRREVVERLKKTLVAQQDSTRDMIEANRDIILSKHEEAIGLIHECLNKIAADKSGMRHLMEMQCKRISAIIKALNQFHPMHGESWSGWPEEN